MARSGAGEYLRAAGIVVIATAACLLLRSRLASIDVAMVLLLGVVAAAATHRRGPALGASLLTIVAFDFLFVPPYGTFNVFDTAYYLTFGVMLVVALTMSGLTGRIREQREAAAARERGTAALYALETDLTGAPDVEGLRAVAIQHLGHAIAGTADILLADDFGTGDAPVLPEGGVFDDAGVRVAAAWAWTRRQPTGWSTHHGRELPAMLVPMLAESGPVGLGVFLPDDPGRALHEDETTMLTAMIALVTNALERRQLARRHERARSEVEAERLRTALLSSLSHDLRTPLASIEGSASSLLDGAATFAPGVQRELLEGIVDESRRMTRLVGNLLDMVRVETGTLAVRKSWQPLEEPLGVALLRMEERLRGHPVATHLPHDLPMVPIDELLIEQVLHQSAGERRALHGARHTDRHQRPAGRGGRAGGGGRPRCRGYHAARRRRCSSDSVAGPGSMRRMPMPVQAPGLASPSAAAFSARTAGGSGSNPGRAAALSPASRCRERACPNRSGHRAAARWPRPIRSC